MITQTSKEIIQELEKTGLKLNLKQKEIIIKKVYKAITDSSEKTFNNNGCNCGQPSCSFCN